MRSYTRMQIKFRDNANWYGIVSSLRIKNALSQFCVGTNFCEKELNWKASCSMSEKHSFWYPPNHMRFLRGPISFNEKRVMLVVLLLNSSISILVLRCSCVSYIASNGNVFWISKEMQYGSFWVNEFIWFDAFFFVAQNNQQIAKWLRSYPPYHTLFLKWPSTVIFPMISKLSFGVM